MTSLPAISTALPSLGSMRRSSSIVAGSGGGLQSSTSGAFPSSNSNAGSPLARSSSMRHEPGAQQQPAPAPVAAGPTLKRGSVSGPALESADDIEMHHVVGLIKSRNLDGFRSWVKEAATVNIKDFAGNTALHWACHKGLPEFVAVLLRRTADKNLTNNNGATPLHCAAIAGVKSVADLLIQAGADPMARNAQGKNFFEVVRSKGHTHLEHAYEDLEYKLMADMNASVHCPSDSWLDANRLGAESDASESEALSDAEASPVLPAIYNKGRTSGAVAQRRSSFHRAPIAAASEATTSPAVGAQTHQSNESELERRIRALEHFHQTSSGGQQTNRSNLGRQGVSPQHPMLELDASTSSLHAGQNVTIPLVASPGVGATVDGSPSHPYGNRHTVPSVGGPSKSIPSGSAPYHSLPLHLQLSQNATPRHATTVSPQRYVGPSGRILCSCCDPETRATATGYCEECRRNGEACWYCDACWATEHTSKRTRLHRRGPVPIPQSTVSNASITPRAHLGGDHLHDLLPFDVSALGPEARAYLMLQQQLLAAFTASHGQHPPAGGPVLGGRAETEAIATQTMEPLQSAYFDEAMLELQDVREQLEAEVCHSQVLIDSTRVQLLEALELRHRGEIEAICWRKLLSIKRPPQVIVVHDPSFIPGTYEGLPRQRAGAAAEVEWRKNQRQAQPPNVVGDAAAGGGAAFLRSMSPPSVHTTSPPVRKRNATNSQAVQCVIRPLCAHATVQTDHFGSDPVPPKQTDGAYPRYAEDAVDVVHGEKHLPDQPQMLLVRWTRGGLESWVPAYEVAHCTAVVAYLTKYDKSLGNSQLLQLTGDELMELQRVCSPMNDSERTQFSQQLAELKRVGTANGSRESLDQLQTGHRPSDDKTKRMRRGSGKPPLATPLSPITKGDVLPASFQPASRGNMASDDEDMPLPPSDERQNDDLEDPTPIPATPSDEDLVRKYEERLKELEVKQDLIKRLREEQAVRLVELKNKQKLVDVQSRAAVHRQYEAKASMLQASQPEKLHPMASTSDKHAALVLQELQQEVLDAERHKTKKGIAAGPASKTGPPQRLNEEQLTNFSKKPPPPPPLLVPSLVPAPQGASARTSGAGVAVPSPSSGPGVPAQHSGPPGVPGEPSFEQKINRILYEQYFYNKAHPSEAGRGRAVSPTTAARQEASDPFRPASLN